MSGEIDYREVARALRLAVVQQQYDVGNLTEDEAKELLSGPLTPGDDTTIVDDSDQLRLISSEAKEVTDANED